MKTFDELYSQSEEYSRRKNKAISALDEWMVNCNVDIRVLADIVNEVMDEHFTNEDDRRTFMYNAHPRIELLVEDCHPTARLIASALSPSCNADEFAKHVAQVLANEFGAHNYKDFTASLLKYLTNDFAG
jgi:6-phosphogluconate dehydrogenase (decarboxylating)